MEELKPRETEALDIIESMLDAADVECTTHTGVTNWDKPVRSGNCRILADDAVKLRKYIADRRAAPENEPLTLEQLRKMNDKRVWIQFRGLGMYGLVAYHSDPDGDDGDDVYITDNLGGRSTFEKILSHGGTVYAREPEGSTS